MTTTTEHLLAHFNELGINYQYYEHAPVFTVEEAKQHCGHIPGAHCKNLFLRNKKRAYWLAVLLNDAIVNLDRLGEVLGAGRLGFANGQRLDEILGVIPGAVTPLALINDQERKVKIALDRRLLDFDAVTFHPLVNHLTIALSPADLLRFLDNMGYEPQFIDLT